jgi:hypothetical protein
MVSHVRVEDSEDGGGGRDRVEELVRRSKGMYRAKNKFIEALKVCD